MLCKLDSLYNRIHNITIQVLRKWEAIDDEIWAKAIVMERNKRVAKVGPVCLPVCL